MFRFPESEQDLSGLFSAALPLHAARVQLHPRSDTVKNLLRLLIVTLLLVGSCSTTLLASGDPNPCLPGEMCKPPGLVGVK